MKSIILVCHGTGEPNAPSIPKVKTITRAGALLYFYEIKEYISTDKSWPEYASTSYSRFFEPFNDAQCLELFGKTFQGFGIINTKLSKPHNPSNIDIYVLLGTNMSKEDLQTYIHREQITSVILCACRMFNENENDH